MKFQTWPILFSVVIITAIAGRCLAEKPVEPAAVQTPALAEWEGLKYGMFIHFAINTFEGIENSSGQAPSKLYAPTQLDVRQWVRTAKQAGMKYIVLTAKHDAGHCLWDSQGYDYDVATSGNQTDVVAEFMKACKEEGIKPGLYYCILDGHNEPNASKDPDRWEKVKWDIPISDKYYELVKQHLTELHTRYPDIYEQWIDIPGKLRGQQRQELYELIKRLSPDCLVLMNAGPKDGVKVHMHAWPTDLIDGERTVPPVEYNPVKVVEGKTYYLPMEVCDTICKYWFWMPNDPPKDVCTLYKLYSESVGRGANLLLDVPPDKTGRIPQEVVERLMDLKAVIDNPALLPKE